MDDELRDLMRVTVPTGQHGTARVERFTVTEEQSAWTALTHGDRYCPPGEYTRLLVDNELWMSDTRAETADHLPFLRVVRAQRAHSVLITGLGLGMVLRACLHLPHVDRVDIIELNADVIALVGEHYTQMARQHGVQLRIHHADAHTGISCFDTTVDRFDLAWHDIWKSIGEHDNTTMDRIISQYRPVVAGRQMCWAEDESRNFLSYIL